MMIHRSTKRGSLREPGWILLWSLSEPLVSFAIRSEGKGKGKEEKRSPCSRRERFRRNAAVFFSVKFNQGYPSAGRSGRSENAGPNIISCVFIGDLRIDTAAIETY